MLISPTYRYLAWSCGPNQEWLVSNQSYHRMFKTSLSISFFLFRRFVRNSRQKSSYYMHLWWYTQKHPCMLMVALTEKNRKGFMIFSVQIIPIIHWRQHSGLKIWNWAWAVAIFFMVKRWQDFTRAALYFVIYESKFWESTIKGNHFCWGHAFITLDQNL